MSTASISLGEDFRLFSIHLEFYEWIFHEGFEHVNELVREFEEFHRLEEEGVADSVEGAAEVKPEDCEGDIVLDGKVSNVLDCSGGQLDTSVCRIAILLLINNMSGGIFQSLSEDAGYNLIRDFKKTDRTD